ncbi:MAG: GNAT family N-acetyltransferase [Pseudomonadota bacterium]
MTTNPITIRNLGPEETHILERVRPGVCDEFDLTRAWALLATRINEFVVALDQGEVIGFVYGSMLMHPDRPCEFLVNACCVHDDYPSSEIGARLMDRLRNLAVDRGCEVMWMIDQSAMAVVPNEIESTPTALYRWAP